MENPILTLSHISKQYPGVLALDDVSLDFFSGEAHGLVGENGAGKSTFIKIITGAIQPTEGEITFQGEVLKDNTPIKSLDLGIVAIYQEFNLFPLLTVAENIFYGSFPKKGIVVDYKEMNRRAGELLSSLGIDINPQTRVAELSIGYQQIVEIAKAISRNAKLLIMDEPSAPLTNNEVECLFNIVKTVKAQGVGIIYISHRLEEIFDICEKVSVFRDGQYITTMDPAQTNSDELIKIMVNRELGEQYPQKTYTKGEKVLEVKNVCTTMLKDISFEAYQGEILGLAGLVGAGRTEIGRAIFGADKTLSGEVLLHGKPIKVRNPGDAIKAGIGLIPEDRKAQGVLLNMSILENISFAGMRKISKLGVLNNKQDAGIADDYIDALKIKTPTSRQLVKNLSGGNQQKVILAKWMFTDSEVIIFDEPTRGIDVGAKQEIYLLMEKLVQEGKIIIMITSEMPELLGMADRIIVMHEGEIAGTLLKEEVSQEEVLRLSSGL